MHTHTARAHDHINSANDRFNSQLAPVTTTPTDRAMNQKPENNVGVRRKQVSVCLFPRWGPVRADGWGKKGLVYLERHRVDSCFSVRTRSLETTRSATRLLLPHRVWVLAAPVRGHNNRRRVSWAQPLQSLPHEGRQKGGRWGALLCASSDTQSKRVASVRKAPAPTMCSTQVNLFKVSLGQLLW